MKPLSVLCVRGFAGRWLSVAVLLTTLAGPAAGAAASGPGYRCTGAPVKLFDSWNGFGVLNGATPPTFSTNGRAYCVASISTYHWNNGVGKPPGTIGLQVVRGLGGALGPWPAVGSAGQGGAPNVNWTVTPPAGAAPAVINGTYRCVDSDAGSWAQNAASGGHGFCAVYVTNAVSLGGAGAAPAGGAAHPNCTPTPPSTFLVYPNHVAPGASTSFLLWCRRPVSLGFHGAFAPVRVLIYDEASFRNLHYVHGRLKPVSPSLPVRPPVVPPFRVVGPNDVEVTLPASMARTVYVPVIVWARGEVASMNLLDLR